MAARLLLTALVPLLAACAIPLEHAELPREELLEIQRDFEAIVAEAHADPDVDWRSGWMGNISVSEDPERRRGLCYQWQEMVFERIAPTVERVGWSAVRVNVNVGHFNEHHAVIVWNPEEIERDRLLIVANPPAWVLDAWDSGRAEIFPLDGWVDGQVFVFTPPALEIPGIAP